jgi:hypothetical protein
MLDTSNPDASKLPDLPKHRKTFEIARYQTLPVSMANPDDSKIKSYRVEMKDTRVLAASDA